MRDHDILPARRGGRASTVQLVRPVVRLAGATASCINNPQRGRWVSRQFRESGENLSTIRGQTAARRRDFAVSSPMLAKTGQRVVLAREAKNAVWSSENDLIFLLGTFLS
ncbi:MAG TPA: hypothetical protein VGU70_03380 [Methylobacterium sp.]|jgi:hypothetical protein|uniref:hypothetical protein n=1 Tax=Methylorubrum sp. B1-46 TaxID=2897334 RepID=UPI001E617C10|nr:hypothetical protein [Methylorubrum sp. B1-46]UGB27882.1 hypothetical protein LPC10_10080 [Methylorubrum sp. B1-46]HEV2541789.1 hypothetical protein [Methylobacterium sp.]